MIRIATVGYLNARPLTSYIDRDVYEVIEGHPSAIARMLRQGEVDVALVPVAAALTDGDFRILPDVCIGAEGPVHSVLLCGEVPVEQWTEVLLDGVSRTSVTLARLLLTQGPLAARVRSDLVVRECAAGEGMENAKGTVASLVIGDAAMRLPERLAHRVDLAQQWQVWTGLPFVFAVWAGRVDLPAHVREDLRTAGLMGIDQRTQDYTGDQLDYVMNSLRYVLDERALVGLRRYAAIAQQAGLVGTDTVQFYGPSVQRLTRVNLNEELERAADGHPLSNSAIRALLSAPLADLMTAADLRRESLRPGDVRWTPCVEVVLTDVDAYGVGTKPEDGGFVRTVDEVRAAAVEADEVEAGELRLSGRRHPGVGVDTWCEAIEAAASATRAEVWALDMGLLDHLNTLDVRDLPQILDDLRSVGLHGVAGGPVLVLDDAVRARVPGALSVADWKATARAVDASGLAWRCGVQIGAGETLEVRLAHLQSLVEHAESGGLCAVQIGTIDQLLGLRPIAATTHDLLRMVAIARLVLPASCEVQALWMHAAPSLAQAALMAGADVLAPVVLPERSAADHGPYLNPRAVKSKRRVTDPWLVALGEVKLHLGCLPRPSRVSHPVRVGGESGADTPRPAV